MIWCLVIPFVTDNLKHVKDCINYTCLVFKYIMYIGLLSLKLNRPSIFNKQFKTNIF